MPLGEKAYKEVRGEVSPVSGELSNGTSETQILTQPRTPNLRFVGRSCLMTLF